MRLGISPTTLKTVSRRFGLPGLALSAGVSGYEMYQNKKKNFNLIFQTGSRLKKDLMS